jgi:hypothetical protein
MTMAPLGRWSGGDRPGPSPIFLGAVLLLATGMTVASAVEGNLAGALLSGGAAAYFALRIFAGMGPRRE